jgi:hypothetical protein
MGHALIIITVIVIQPKNLITHLKILTNFSLFFLVLFLSLSLFLYLFPLKNFLEFFHDLCLYLSSPYSD